ncbi:MAG: alpha/beta hydrolase [Proteobacteria bacterium]|nr:alpha/beta hydrolase [Pseudomonadota bacterium]
MIHFPDAAAWRKACAHDATLHAWEGAWSVSFAITSGSDTAVFNVVNGKVQQHEGRTPAFTLAAPTAVWTKFLQEVPPRHHHGMFAMHYRVPEFAITGDELAFMQHAHVVRRVLEVGKWLAHGYKGPTPASLAPRDGLRPIPEVTGRYVPVTLGHTTYQIYYETVGTGRDVLCLHTAGSDARQFHGLMAEADVIASNRLVAFDLPWHGKSPPPEGGIPGSWRLNTDLYVDLIMSFVAAAGLEKPIVLGASMSGEICLELAYRHPEAFSGIIACEACEKIERRQTSWAAHPLVNQAYFVPEWIRALCAPQSPAEYQEAIAWHYSQGGPSVFFGDIAFYSGDWDARDRVHKIDTKRCRLFMLTGEYDYSCTIEASEATAKKIPGAVFKPMPGIGHFPFAENPPLFAEYLLPILRELG